MAKDILWFHAVIWPCMLMALDRPLPRVVYAHAYFVREGRKMSKSLGNFVDIDTIRAYCARYSRDAVRWYLATQGPLGQNDADFAHGKFVEVYNADLANGIGNSTSRVGNMIAKYFDGRVPAPGTPIEVPGAPAGEYDWPTVIHTAAATAVARADGFDITGALHQGLGLVKRVDSFINATEPFRLAKTVDADPAARQRLGTILYSCAEALRAAAVIMSPAIPDAADRLLASWDARIPECHATRTLSHVCQWAGEHSLRPGGPLTKGEPLFMRADPAEPAPGKTTA
jgi:methionyl-tRNA synthetase